MNANEIKSPMGVTVEDLKKRGGLHEKIYYAVGWNRIAFDLQDLCLSLSDALDTANKRIAELEAKLQPSPQPEAEQPASEVKLKRFFVAGEGMYRFRMIVKDQPYFKTHNEAYASIEEHAKRCGQSPLLFNVYESECGPNDEPYNSQMQPAEPQPEAIDSSHLTKEWARSEARRETEADETPNPKVGETWHTVNDGDVIIRKVREHFVDVSHANKPDEIAGAVSIRHLISKVEVQPVELQPGMTIKLPDDPVNDSWTLIAFDSLGQQWIGHQISTASTTNEIPRPESCIVFINNQWLDVSTGKPVQP